jgi:hypothetical protein
LRLSALAGEKSESGEECFPAKAQRRQGKIAKTRSLKFETNLNRAKIQSLKQLGSD